LLSHRRKYYPSKLIYTSFNETTFLVGIILSCIIHYWSDVPMYIYIYICRSNDVIYLTFTRSWLIFGGYDIYLFTNIIHYTLHNYILLYIVPSVLIASKNKNVVDTIYINILHNTALTAGNKTNSKSFNYVNYFFLWPASEYWSTTIRVILILISNLTFNLQYSLWITRFTDKSDLNGFNQPHAQICSSNNWKLIVYYHLVNRHDLSGCLNTERIYIKIYNAIEVFI